MTSVTAVAMLICVSYIVTKLLPDSKTNEDP
jgi:hypothetical protein